MVNKLKRLEDDAKDIVAFLSDESAVKHLRQDKAYNLRFLQEVKPCCCLDSCVDSL